MSMRAAARRYAKALFDLGVEAGAVEKVTAEVRELGETIAKHDELRTLLANPTVPPAARKAILMDIVTKMGVSPVVAATVQLLADHGRTGLVPQIAEALTELADVRAGKLRAEVVSAVELTDAQCQRLIASLEKLTGRKISLLRKVDKSLIGGVITRVGDKVYDGSVRTRLEELRRAMLPS